MTAEPFFDNVPVELILTASVPLQELLAAVVDGSPSSIVNVLTRGSNADARTSDGATPIMVAASLDDAPSIQALAAHGATIDATYHHTGQTAFHQSCANGRVGSVETLVQLGCDQTLRDKEGKTGMECARDASMTAVVDALQTLEAAGLEALFAAEDLQVPEGVAAAAAPAVSMPRGSAQRQRKTAHAM